MSDTPRTDENIVVYPREDSSKEYVWADFARKLEQELKEANHRLDVKCAEANHYKAETEQLRKASDGWDDYAAIKELQRQNAALRAQNAELRDTLEIERNPSLYWEKKNKELKR